MSDSARAQLHAPFRSRRGRVIGYTSALVQAVAFVVVALILPWGGQHPTAWYDRAGFLLVAAAVGWFLYRLGSVSALPSEDGLVVRNLLLTRSLEWPEIETVHYGNGAPWPTLDVTDGDTLAVMAIQRADGAAGTAEVRRLATLVAVHAPRA